MLLYTLSGMIRAIPLITVFLIISVGTFLYALWNIWQQVDERFRPKICGYIALFSVFFHGTTIAVDTYFQGLSLQSTAFFNDSLLELANQ